MGEGEGLGTGESGGSRVGVGMGVGEGLGTGESGGSPVGVGTGVGEGLGTGVSGGSPVGVGIGVGGGGVGAVGDGEGEASLVRSGDGLGATVDDVTPVASPPGVMVAVTLTVVSGILASAPSTTTISAVEVGRGEGVVSGLTSSTRLLGRPSQAASFLTVWGFPARS